MSGAWSESPGAAATPTVGLTLHDATGRWVLAAAVLGSGMAGLDATVVNVALPTIRTDLHTSLAAGRALQKPGAALLLPGTDPDAFVDGLHVLGVGGCLLWLLAIGLTC